jgi:hypothetical protein
LLSQITVRRSQCHFSLVEVSEGQQPLSLDVMIPCLIIKLCPVRVVRHL